jgi:hypothetical protein
MKKYIYFVENLFIYSPFNIDCTGVNPMEEEICLVDSGTTNSILREIKYFQTLTMNRGNVLTITGRDAVILDSGRANVMLSMVQHW